MSSVPDITPDELEILSAIAHDGALRPAAMIARITVRDVDTLNDQIARLVELRLVAIFDGDRVYLTDRGRAHILGRLVWRVVNA